MAAASPCALLMSACFSPSLRAMLASRSPLSHRFAKEVVKRTVGMHMDEALRLESRSFHDVGLTDDLAEGTTAFRERRDAHFKGS